MPVGRDTSQAHTHPLPQDGTEPPVWFSKKGHEQKYCGVGEVRRCGGRPGPDTEEGGTSASPTDTVELLWQRLRYTATQRRYSGRYRQLHANPRSFIEFSVFCKCKHASSKHNRNERSSDTARGRVAFQQKAGLAQHRNQQRGGLSRARRALPSVTTSGDAAVRGAGQRRCRNPATGTSASQGASGKGAGAERCPMGGLTAQSLDTHGLGPTWPHSVISTVQDSQGAADTLGPCAADMIPQRTPHTPKGTKSKSLSQDKNSVTCK